MKILEKEVSDIIYNIFHLDVDCSLNTEFSYSFDENLLCFPPVYYAEEKAIDFQWHKWLQDTFQVEFEFWQLFVFSFMHELGHKITIPNLTDDEFNSPFGLTDQIQYYSTKREYVASAWAMRMCLHHADLLNEFCVELDRAFQDFYRRNDIQDID